MKSSDSSHWDHEYKQSGIPSSVKEGPSNVVVTFLDFIQNTGDSIGTALDVGCGRGRNSIFLAQKGYSVTSLDYAAPQVDALKQTAQESDLHIKAIVHDIRQPWPVEDKTIDLAIDAFCFKHVIEHEAVLLYARELKRVLKPGGKAMLFLASRADGYYRQFGIEQDEFPGLIIRDPGNDILSRLYDANEFKVVFGDFRVLSEQTKAGHNVMHGNKYDRESLVFYLENR